jgi:methyltransferase-like protein
LQRIAPDVIRQEQFMDFLDNRHFRQTLLVRKEIAVNRVLTPDRVVDLWVSGSLEPVGSGVDIHSSAMQEFRARGGVLRTANAVTKAAAAVLADRWPQALAFTDLLAEAQAMLRGNGGRPGAIDARAKAILAADVLQCFGAGLVELHAAPSAFVSRPGDRPRASPLARLQVRSGARVTNLRHETVNLEPDLEHLLPLLDGTRSSEEIERAAMDRARTDTATEGQPRPPLQDVVYEQFAQAYNRLARLALLY